VEGVEGRGGRAVAGGGLLVKAAAVGGGVAVGVNGQAAVRRGRSAGWVAPWRKEAGPVGGWRVPEAWYLLARV
jgi:hypothetical protein